MPAPTYYAQNYALMMWTLPITDNKYQYLITPLFMISPSMFSLESNFISSLESTICNNYITLARVYVTKVYSLYILSLLSVDIIGLYDLISFNTVLIMITNHINTTILYIYVIQKIYSFKYDMAISYFSDMAITLLLSACQQDQLDHKS